MNEILSRLRSRDWMVAAHNDYKLDGRRMTFWLLTHGSGVNGRFVKGEAATDAEALAQCEDAADRLGV